MSEPISLLPPVKKIHLNLKNAFETLNLLGRSQKDAAFCVECLMFAAQMHAGSCWSLQIITQFLHLFSGGSRRVDVAEHGQVRGGFRTPFFRRPPDNLLGERHIKQLSASLSSSPWRWTEWSTLGFQTTRCSNPLHRHPGHSPPQVPPTVESITHLLHYSSEINTSFTRPAKKNATVNLSLLLS